MAQHELSRSIILFGTEEPVERGRALHAGALPLEFQNGPRRYIRVGDKEVMRAVALDGSRSTCETEIADLDPGKPLGGGRIERPAHGLAFLSPGAA